MKPIKPLLFLLTLVCLNVSVFSQPKVTAKLAHNPTGSAAIQQGTIVTEHLLSKILQDNLIGLESNRSIKIYLPPGYAHSGKAYPVVYYLHNIHWSPEQMFAHNNIQQLLERGFVNGVVDEFIFIAANYSSPTGGSLYGNSTTSGRWLDFTTEEFVPFIDKRFRTIKNRNSRGITGDFFGAYGTLKLAMTRSDLFGVAYALHPVGAGNFMPWAAIPVDWKKIHEAKTFAELPAGREQMFVSMAQNFLPNPNRPPFYCDFYFEEENGEAKFHAENTKQMQKKFLLDRLLEESAGNLRSMRGLAIDWARYDQTYDHLYTVEQFSRRLDDLGVEHEAEEYRGNPYNKNWTEDGRFYARVLPFFARYLVFEVK